MADLGRVEELALAWRLAKTMLSFPFGRHRRPDGWEREIIVELIDLAWRLGLGNTLKLQMVRRLLLQDTPWGDGQGRHLCNQLNWMERIAQECERHERRTTP